MMSHSWIKRLLHSDKKMAERAPEPVDIIWENMGIEHSKKNKVRLISIILSALVIIVSFVILLGLSTLNKEVSKNSKTLLAQFLSIISSLFILIINSIMADLFLSLSKYERNSTYQAYFTKFTMKLSIVNCLKLINTKSTLINTAFIPFLTLILVAKSFSNVDIYSNCN